MSRITNAARDAVRNPWLPEDPDVDAEGRPVHLRATYAAYVALGGFVGTGVREALSLWFRTPADRVNWTILAINVSGAFLLGALVQLLAGRGPDHGRRRTVRLLLGTGMLGGFTTYSTFAEGAAQLIRENEPGMAIGYCGLTVGVGLLASFAGIAAAQRAHRVRR
ncbi:CrcB family protein [Allobranchiibius sp. GilTou73]|uniref:fluoride efflux transporter FluC n=1 Tax=Allobranchiibius sp. GilTou73 TaxID=2904523 RepID=UPI001F2BF96F|nr:CrcB family protein [Allobranchiibius sp. GilTou73]UIJ36237.1 CrcB family protein [Allobranchiibius sp. GilTou73]